MPLSTGHRKLIKVANGDTAVKIYDSSYYAYGYDVMMAKKLAEQMGYDGVEIHKVEWDSIGMGLDSGIMMQ